MDRESNGKGTSTGNDTSFTSGSASAETAPAETASAGRALSRIDRRDFLVRFCHGVGGTLIPAKLWGFAVSDALDSYRHARDSGYHLHPHYRSQRPLDATLSKLPAGSDEFITEKYADQIAAILEGWSDGLRRSPPDMRPIAGSLTGDFSGISLEPGESRMVRSRGGLDVWRTDFSRHSQLSRDAFLRGLQAKLSAFSEIFTAEFQVTSIEAGDRSDIPGAVATRVRYEIAGTGNGFHREQQIGYWNLIWKPSATGEFRLQRWGADDETRARSHAPVYVDITAASLAANPSYSAQLLHGTDYWRTVLDGACGIDIYGHNGVSVADIDDDGFDDLYLCQPAGLPNRLYRNRGDGTFEDITEASGLGILENTACALFADFNNDGRQDVIVVRAGGPLLFLNEGGGKFRAKPDAFQFANPPQGTFTGAALADYDRDGWLDVYFCLYAYYQGTGQYKYPSPYHDAENGPPNFLLRNHRDGTFRDVTAEAGLDKNNTRYSFCCGWNDYNRDGWPDLYVVNDFGRKNLYRNNGDGTFTDVAPQAGVEDVGAGMSVCWFDANGDGREDVYVGNMWTAAGLRIAMQDVFRKTSSEAVRSMYRKHAEGNSLFRNLGTSFENVTHPAGAGVGRWSWSSDAFDFDHDGRSDLYITNGMVSGSLQSSRDDLNSFFWRQVVARSPDEARASSEYEAGWSAINELIRSDGTWSGYERNIFYANNGDGTFSDVSAAVGLDLVEDGRSFALADLDHDGRLEIVVKNRNAPQLRLLKNFMTGLPPSIAFRLRGTKSNCDAIGAAVTVYSDGGSQTRTLQAGAGFLSQHSKDLFFGLGETKAPIRASIRWPSGLLQELVDLPLNHRIWIEEGSAMPRMEAFKTAPTQLPNTAQNSNAGEQFPTIVETWLLAPYPAPDFTFSDWEGKQRTLSTFRGKPMLLNLGTPESQGSIDDLQTLGKAHARWTKSGWQVLALNIGEGTGYPKNSFALDRKSGLPPMLRSSEDVAAIYNIVYRQLFDRHRDLVLPTSFLIDENGEIVKVYQGPVDDGSVERDFQSIPTNDAGRLARALPFQSSSHSLEFGRNYLSYGALFFQRSYLDQAEVAFQRALREDPSSAEAVYGIGRVYLDQNNNAAARESFERAVKLQANYPDTMPDAWNNLGVMATREGRIDASIACFQQALKLNAHHLLALDNLGNAYRLQKRWADARTMLERALEVAPQDAEANYSLGMVYTQTNETAKAEDYLHRALSARPAYPEALNNLGVLYLLTERRDAAVASFEQSIRVASAFDQAYLNLARLYALEGARDKARSVLDQLLKQHPDHPQAKQMLEQLQ